MSRDFDIRPLDPLVRPDYTFVRETDAGRKVYTGEPGGNPLWHRTRGHRPRRPYLPRSLRPLDYARGTTPVNPQLTTVNPPASQVSFPAPEEFAAELQKTIEATLVEFNSGLEAYIEFLSYLIPAQLALSEPENQEMTLGEHYQPHIHRQPHYTPRLTLPHPRKEILDQRRSVKDMVDEKELDFLDLPPFTAEYKLRQPEGRAMIKGVLATHGLDYFFKEHPYYISYGLRRDILAATRLTFCLPRDKIEAQLKPNQADTHDILPSDQLVKVPEAPEEQKQSRKRERVSKPKE